MVRRKLALLLLLAAPPALVATGACGPATPGGAVPSVDPASFPPWTGRARELFDDNIEARAVGIATEGGDPRSDRLLRERAQVAEAVVRVKVITVTVDSIGDETKYTLGVVAAHPPVAPGPRLKDDRFDLAIRATTPSYPIARSLGARMRGLTFVAFFHRFLGESGELELHWHLAPDTPEVVTAVKDATALRDLAGS